MTAKTKMRTRTRYSREIQPAVFVYQLAKRVSALDDRLSRWQNLKLLRLVKALKVSTHKF